MSAAADGAVADMDGERKCVRWEGNGVLDALAVAARG